ncbi:MAG: hypothetical protein FD153_165 [Rhodospirillaceae bacterium]|nr:MAG: hypothetical protein FD153_165 [Rhodospirillaceae bacterium]
MNDSPDTLPAVGADYEARYMVVNCTNDPITDMVGIHDRRKDSRENSG